MIGLVTQNIDGLHTQSGCTNVIELHGHCRSCHCMTCGQSVSMVEVHGRYCDGQLAPSCQGVENALGQTLFCLATRSHRRIGTEL